MPTLFSELRCEDMDTSPLTPVVAALRTALHLLAVALTAVVVIGALIGEPSSPAAAVVALAWVGTYFAGGWAVRHRGTRVWLLLLTALWVIDVVLIDTAVYLVFVLFFLFLHLGGRLLGPIAVGLSTVVAVVGFALHNGWSAAAVIGPVLGACVAVVISLGYRQLFVEARQRQELIDQLVTTSKDLAAQQQAVGRAAERERLAGEIHDTVAQGLSSIQMLLHAAQRSEPAQASPLIELARTTAADGLADTRRLIAELAPAQLTGSTLVDAITRVVEGARAHGIRAQMVVDGEPVVLPMPVEAALVRITQSAIANVVRHAQAEALHVTVTYTPDDVHLDVVDDGVGFDVGAVSGFGLDTVRRRVAELGGRMEMSSEPGRTALSVSFPVPDSSSPVPDSAS